MTYDHWKTTEPEPSGEGDFRLCDNCNSGLSLNDYGELFCERCDVSQCEACGEYKADCISTSFHGLDVYACAACRGAEEERDEAADRGDFECHQRRGE